MYTWENILSRDQMSEFKNRNIIVAGGANGIGASIVGAFYWLGAQTVILDKDEASAHLLVEGFENEQKKDNLKTLRPIVIGADLSDEKQRVNTMSSIAQDFNNVYGFVSTLGLDTRVELSDHSQEDLEHLLRVNFIAPVMLARDIIPIIHKAGGGAVCLFSSHHGLGLIDTATLGYGAAKAALENSILRLAKYAGEMNTAERNVRVFGIRPGWIQTDNQTKRFAPEDFAGATTRQLLPVQMKAEDLVPFVVSTMSNQYSRLLSGTVINYDAGSDQISRE